MIVICCFLALALGVLLKKQLISIRLTIANLLSYIIIPILIIFNMINLSTYKAYIIIWYILLMLFLTFIASRYTKDKIYILCFSYINVGAVGIPVAHIFFNDEAVTFLIYAYIGNSLFGNILSVIFLKPSTNNNFLSLLKNSLYSPPVIAILLSIPLYFCKEWINTNLEFVYEFSKSAMAIIALYILGTWLSLSGITNKYFFNSILKAYAKSIIIILFSIPLMLIAYFTDNFLIINNFPTIILLSLLPPAANIIVLETSYLNTGYSAKIISTETIISIFLITTYVIIYKLIY